MKILILTQDNLGLTPLDNETSFFSLRAGHADEDVTEERSTTFWEVGGTLSQCRINIYTHDVNLSTNFYVRKNGVDTSLGFSIPATTTGQFADTSTSVSITAGDDLSYRMPIGLSGTTIEMSGISVVFEPTSGNKYVMGSGDISAVNTAGTTYIPFTEIGADVATETDALTRIPIAVNISLLRIYLGSAGHTEATVTLRKNQASTALAVTIPATTSGDFYDNTDTVSVAAGDDLNWMLSYNSTNSLFLTNLEVHIENTVDSKFAIISSDPSGELTGDIVTEYYPLIADTTNLATAQESYAPFGMNATLSNFSLVVLSNSHGSAIVMNLYKNGAVGNQSVTIPASASGDFEDTVDTDTVAVGDLVCYQGVIVSSGSCYILSTAIIADGGSSDVQLINDSVYKTGMKIFD